MKIVQLVPCKYNIRGTRIHDAHTCACTTVKGCRPEGPWLGLLFWCTVSNSNSCSDSKVHGANMGPTWVLSVPDGPHVGPMNLAIRVWLISRLENSLVHLRVRSSNVLEILDYLTIYRSGSLVSVSRQNASFTCRSLPFIGNPWIDEVDRKQQKTW